MANPQTEDGYTAIANELLEVICRTKFNATQLKIILFVIRYTYGYQRDTHKFPTSFIANGTGLSERYVWGELAKLIETKVIRVVGNPSRTESKIMGLNKNYELWKDYRAIVHKKNTSIAESLHSTIAESSYLVNKKINKNIYSDDEQFVLNFWNEKNIVNHDPTDRMKKEISKALKKYGKDNIVTAINNYATAYLDDSFYYTHIWRLDRFLKQENGLPNFLDDGQMWLNYLNEKKNRQKKENTGQHEKGYYEPSYLFNDVTGRRLADEGHGIDEMKEELTKKLGQT